MQPIISGLGAFAILFFFFPELAQFLPIAAVGSAGALAWYFYNSPSSSATPTLPAAQLQLEAPTEESTSPAYGAVANILGTVLSFAFSALLYTIPLAFSLFWLTLMVRAFMRLYELATTASTYFFGADYVGAPLTVIYHILATLFVFCIVVQLIPSNESETSNEQVNRAVS